MAFALEKYYFADTFIFDKLPAKERLELTQHMIRKKMKAGKLFYREGAAPKGMYLLRKGKVKIFLTTQDGRKHIMYIYTQGEQFGYRPIICQEMHPVTAAALEDCLYDFIPVEHFQKCLRNSPELNRLLLISLSHEFGVWVNNISVFAHYPVKSRVALGLLILREKYKVRGKATEINLSRADLASYVGSVKETVVRTLQEFRRRKIVETNGRKIKVLRPDELRTIVNFY